MVKWDEVSNNPSMKKVHLFTDMNREGHSSLPVRTCEVADPGLSSLQTPVSQFSVQPSHSLPRVGRTSVLHIRIAPMDFK